MAWIRPVARISPDQNDLLHIAGDVGAGLIHAAGNDDRNHRRYGIRRSRTVTGTTGPGSTAALRHRGGETFEGSWSGPTAERMVLYPLGAPESYLLSGSRIEIADDERSNSGHNARRRHKAGADADHAVIG
jgi:hypothetical protein